MLLCRASSNTSRLAAPLPYPAFFRYLSPAPPLCPQRNRIARPQKYEMSSPSSTARKPSVSLIAQGASIQHLPVSNPRTGKKYDIVLGFPADHYYATHNGPFFGETIGRVANRISGAKINSLNGRSYELAANNGPNALHGGVKGWGKKKWDGPFDVIRPAVSETGDEGEIEATLFKYLSKDGDEGYPGTVEARVWYTPRYETGFALDKTVLGIEYEVEFVGEDDGVQETVINMSNHSYFNLSPDSNTIDKTVVTLKSTDHMVMDSGSIPVGPIAPYPNITANTPFTLGVSEPDIDDCFIMPPNNTTTFTAESPSNIPIDTRSLDLRLLASFSHPDTGIHLEVWSTEPAFQFYTGRYIDVPEIKEDGSVVVKGYGPRAGFCVEPSRFVNAINREEWASMVKLKRGEKYGCKIMYKAWVE